MGGRGREERRGGEQRDIGEEGGRREGEWRKGSGNR